MNGECGSNLGIEAVCLPVSHSDPGSFLVLYSLHIYTAVHSRFTLLALLKSRDIYCQLAGKGKRERYIIFSDTFSQGFRWDDTYHNTEVKYSAIHFF
jgi:hypothetical protein